jgi:2-keto-4-pentenoate hydratase/2-oxohepta-3-ene-1,7-dioic acid hydratase in catechol pathway
MTKDGFEPNSSSSWCSAKAAATSPKKNALRHVAGYSVGIDFTARDLFFARSAPLPDRAQAIPRRHASEFRPVRERCKETVRKHRGHDLLSARADRRRFPGRDDRARREKLKPGDTVRIEADLIGSMEVVIR